MCTPHRARAPTRSLEARTRAVVVLGPFVPVRTGAGGNSHEELRGGFSCSTENLSSPLIDFSGRPPNPPDPRPRKDVRGLKD